MTDADRLHILKSAMCEIIAMEDRSWLPMQIFRSDEQVAADDAKHDAWTDAAGICRAALQEAGL